MLQSDGFGPAYRDLARREPVFASPAPAHCHASERPAARACAAGLALLTVRAAEDAAKVNRCRETAR